jgi:hypothetical protein
MRKIIRAKRVQRSLSDAKAKTDWSRSPKGEGGPLGPRATARQASLRSSSGRPRRARSNQNTENNPMQSSRAVVGNDALRHAATTFDMSGKSAAQLYRIQTECLERPPIRFRMSNLVHCHRNHFHGRLRPSLSWLLTQSPERMALPNDISPASTTPAQISANLFALPLP